MKIAINNLLKTFKIRIRNKNVIIKFKKKNLNNLIKKKDSFKKTLGKIKLIANFYYYKF
jgi:rRNA pseudouridine-1189 N-methylase Emg1 (Nep1/Mra1 family)